MTQEHLPPESERQAPTPERAEPMQLPYASTDELMHAFRKGKKFVLHYHGTTYDVTHMEARFGYVYVRPPSLPVKVRPNGTSVEGAAPDIYLAEVTDLDLVRTALGRLSIGPVWREAMDALMRIESALSQAAVLPMSGEPSPSDAMPGLRLRFFRDLAPSERFKVLRVFGVVPDGVGEDEMNHTVERRLLDLAVAALVAALPPKDRGGRNVDAR